jgi:hypothetical protein
MDTLLTTFGLTLDQFWLLVIVVVGGLVVLGVLRGLFRMAANLVRIGCVLVVIMAIAVVVFGLGS